MKRKKEINISPRGASSQDSVNHESRRKGERKGSKEEPTGKKRGKRGEEEGREEGREEGDRRKEWRKEIRGRRRGGDPHTRQGGPGRLLARECPPWRSWPRRPAGRRRVEGEGGQGGSGGEGR